MFVSGQLPTIEAVREHLGVSLYAVENQARMNKWMEARDHRVSQLIARVSELPPLSVERSREGLEEIAKLQEELAKSLIGSASRLQAIRDNAAAVADSLIARLASIDPGANREGIESRLASVMAVSDSLSEQLRILAGLPDPDKVRPVSKPSPAQDQPKPTQSKSRPEPTGPISKPIHADQGDEQ